MGGGRWSFGIFVLFRGIGFKFLVLGSFFKGLGVVGFFLFRLFVLLSAVIRREGFFLDCGFYFVLVGFLLIFRIVVIIIFVGVLVRGFRFRSVRFKLGFSVVVYVFFFRDKVIGIVMVVVILEAVILVYGSNEVLVGSLVCVGVMGVG